MSAPWESLVPEALHGAVRDALAATYGKAPVEFVSQVTGGASGAVALRLASGGRQHLLRVEAWRRLAENLELAKKIRRRTIRDSRRESGRLLDLSSYPEEVAAVAEIFFELPRAPDATAETAPFAAEDAEPGSDLDVWDRFRRELATTA